MRKGGRAWRWAALGAAAAVQAGLLYRSGSTARLTSALMLAAALWAVTQHIGAARRERGRSRAVWATAAAGTLLWISSMLWYAPDELVRNQVAVRPSPGDVPSVLALTAAGVAMLLAARPPRDPVGRSRMVLDGLLLAIGLFGFAWLTVLRQVIDWPAASYDGVPMAYAVAVVVVTAIALLLIAGDRRTGGDTLSLLCAGVAVVGAGAFLAALASVAGLGTAGEGGVLPLAAGIVTTGFAARRRLPVAAGTTWDSTTRLGRTVPYLPVVVVFCCALYVRVTTGGFDPVLAGTAYLLAAAVLGRQFLTMWVNARLQHKVDEQRQRLAHQAQHDQLTGLANRALLADRMDRAVAAADGSAGEPAVLLVDLDGFKAINETHGHAAGDELLVAVAGRLRARARPADTTARLGGDEFAILLPTVSGPATVAAVARDILDRLSEPVALADGEITVRASIGAAIADPADRGDVDRLLRDADVALYAAKADGKGRFRLADSRLRASAREQMQLDRELRGALHRRELEVHYQPIIELSTGRVTGAEALLRWQHTERGLLAPAAFLPTAEAAGLLPDIDRWVLREACRQALRWRKRVPQFSVSVNISAGHLTNATLVDDVTGTLAETGLTPEALVLELTETALVTDTDTAARVLAELAKLGVRVALDDFGTGYSSLTYLRTLPIHTIKIDRSFVSGLGDGAANDAVTMAMLDLAGTLGLHQVAEGVETDEQASRLRGLHCTYGQGYHFSRPVPPDRFFEILTDGGASPTLPPRLAVAPRRAAA